MHKKQQRRRFFVRIKTSKGVKIDCFTSGAFCVREMFLLKKKKNGFEIVLTASINYTTDVYPHQPTYWTSIYPHLFFFVIICKNLFFFMKTFLFVRISFFSWKLFWILFICENIFFSWKFFESFLSVRIFSFS